WRPTEDDRLCSAHFINGKSNNPLSVDYLPSIFEFVPSPKKRKLKADAERYEQRQSLKKQRQDNVRVKEAAKALLMIAEPPEKPHSSSSYSQPPDQDTTSTSSLSSNNEINIFIGPPSPTSNDLADPDDAPITPDLHMEIAALRRENLALKQELLKVTITKESLMQNPAKLKFFTGLSHITILEAVIEFLEPLLPDLGKLSKFQQIIVTLIKLRLNVGHQLIAYQFGVHASTISKHLHNVVSLMYTVLVPEVIRRPECEQLRNTLPMCFRATFPKCAVIIDCFEVQVEKASDQTANAQTYSQYKSRNTLKYLIGISPLGAVTFISKGWGGRTSDKYITENSGFLRHLVPGDVVMADRGFFIEESVAMQGAKLEIPAFTRGKSQLDKREVESTRKLASVRIHVERVIGTIRQKYQVLQGPLELTFTVPDAEENVMLYDKMVHVACALTNLSKPIVPSD
ncbi:hypothetical protein CAPTEDRAFT_129777, partial [Capitella teleta]